MFNEPIYTLQSSTWNPPPPPTLESPHVYKSFMPMSHIRLYIFIQDESGSVYSQFTSCLDRNCETADQFLFYSVANLETFSRELELNMKLTEPFRYKCRFTVRASVFVNAMHAPHPHIESTAWSCDQTSPVLLAAPQIVPLLFLFLCVSTFGREKERCDKCHYYTCRQNGTTEVTFLFISCRATDSLLRSSLPSILCPTPSKTFGVWFTTTDVPVWWCWMRSTWLR